MAGVLPNHHHDDHMGFISGAYTNVQMIAADTPMAPARKLHKMYLGWLEKTVRVRTVSKSDNFNLLDDSIAKK